MRVGSSPVDNQQDWVVGLVEFGIQTVFPGINRPEGVRSVRRKEFCVVGGGVVEFMSSLQ